MNPLTRQRAVIYTRVSHDKQLEGYSLGEQEGACRQVIDTRSWEFIERYTDEGVSARTTDRPAFMQMLADATSGQFTVIVVHKLDRFSRSVTDMLLTMRELERRGVTVVSATEDFDFSTPIGRVLLTLLAAFAEWYINNLAQEARKGHEGRARAGKQNGAPPYGYINVEGITIPDGDYSRIVQQIFELYAQGNSATTIAKTLNRHGIQAPAVGRRKDALPVWSKDTIGDILKNRFYIGEIRYIKEFLPGTHEPLISHDLWQKVELVRYERSNKKQSAGRPATVGVYLCSRRAYCIQCGNSVRATSGGGNHGTSARIRYYTCDGVERQHGCRAKRTRVDITDKQLGEYLKSLTLPADWQSKIAAIAESQMERTGDGVGEKIKALQQSIRRQKRLLAVAEDDAEAASLTADIQRDQAELKYLQHAVRPARPVELIQAGEFLANFSTLWDAATPEEQQQLVRAIAVKIWINENGLDHVEIKPAFKLLLATTAKD